MCVCVCVCVCVRGKISLELLKQKNVIIITHVPVPNKPYGLCGRKRPKKENIIKIIDNFSHIVLLYASCGQIVNEFSFLL